MLWVTVILILTCYQIGRYIWNVYFHPLSKYPGPKLWAASRLPHEITFSTGKLGVTLVRLHERYGDVVRISPTSLSYIHPDAWNDIYNRTAGRQPLPKDPKRYTKDLWINGAPEVWTSDDETHARLRKAIAPGFSDRALRDQETVVQRNVDEFMGELRQSSQDDPATKDSKIDISSWISFVTFDIIGDLAFGEPFGNVKRGKYHPWIAGTMDSGRAWVVMCSIRQFPWLEAIISRLLRKKIAQTLENHQKLAIEKVDKRMLCTSERGDFMDVMMAKRGTKGGLTQDEIYSNANFLILAGGETSSASLVGCIYHLMTHPSVMQQVTSQIRDKFEEEEHITFESLQGLEYLDAVLKESMRLYPGNNFNPRIVPTGGAQIAGRFVPEDTSVQIVQYVAYHSASNFEDPEQFIPERFMEHGSDKHSNLAVFHPFTVGPRQCIGEKLAYAQMKLILARLLWSFDIEISPEIGQWTDQALYLVWARSPLPVKLHRVQR